MIRPDNSSRNEFIDYLKGVLIFLVVWGHVTQYIGCGDNGFWWDPVYKFIYIFHMPLFMAVAGYLAWYGLDRRSPATYVSRRFYQLVIPMLAWALLSNILALAFHRTVVENMPVDIWNGFILRYWFLWAVFLSGLIFTALKFIKRDGYIYCLLAIAGVWCLPECQALTCFKYTFPFFCAGMLLHRWRKLRITWEWISFLLLVAVISYLGWIKRDYVYVSGMILSPGNMTTLIFRYLAAAVFSCLSLVAIKKLYPKAFKGLFTFLGRNTLAIYIIQDYVLVDWFMPLKLPVPHALWFSLGVAPWLALLIAVFCAIVANAISQIPLCARWLFGRVR